MTKEELEKEAREYLAEHSEYSEVFGETFVAVDTLTAMVDFAEPREKRIEELEQKLETERSSRIALVNKITELEKENERLTDELKSLQEKIKDLEAEKDKAWWEGFDTCKAKAGEANVKLSDEITLLKAQIEKMKCDLLELRNDSYDAGMYLRIDELIQKWEIKEND